MMSAPPLAERHAFGDVAIDVEEPRCGHDRPATRVRASSLRPRSDGIPIRASGRRHDLVAARGVLPGLASSARPDPDEGAAVRICHGAGRLLGQAGSVACAPSESPLGQLQLAATADGVVRLGFEGHGDFDVLRERSAGGLAARSHALNCEAPSRSRGASSPATSPASSRPSTGLSSPRRSPRDSRRCAGSPTGEDGPTSTSPPPLRRMSSDGTSAPTRSRSSPDVTASPAASSPPQLRRRPRAPAVARHPRTTSRSPHPLSGGINERMCSADDRPPRARGLPRRDPRRGSGSARAAARADATFEACPCPGERGTAGLASGL
jgi:hypothetical protein